MSMNHATIDHPAGNARMQLPTWRSSDPRGS
jgi:hypothetical protein